MNIPTPDDLNSGPDHESKGVLEELIKNILTYPNKVDYAFEKRVNQTTWEMIDNYSSWIINRVSEKGWNIDLDWQPTGGGTITLWPKGKPTPSWIADRLY